MCEAEHYLGSMKGQKMVRVSSCALLRMSPIVLRLRRRGTVESEAKRSKMAVSSFPCPEYQLPRVDGRGASVSTAVLMFLPPRTTTPLGRLLCHKLKREGRCGTLPHLEDQRFHTLLKKVSHAGEVGMFLHRLLEVALQGGGRLCLDVIVGHFPRMLRWLRHENNLLMVWTNVLTHSNMNAQNK